MSIVYFLLIGLAAGFIAGRLLQGRGFGIVGNLLVGVIGAVAGGLVFKLIGLRSVSLLGELVSAVVGAVLVLLVVGFINKHAK
jgi:uncharacterized membrane protein YeaQ/YmgE (transglycosylase-associated protein family)